MGLNFGGSSSKSTANQSTSGSTSDTYSQPQSALQSMLLSAFSSLVPGMTTGQLSPNVAAAATGSADAINKTGTATGTKIQQFLASRGFGGSGQSGQAELANQLQTSSNLAGNESAAAGQQLNLTSGYLSDALNAAFKNNGTTTNSTGNTNQSGSASNWGASGSLAFGF